MSLMLIVYLIFSQNFPQGSRSVWYNKSGFTLISWWDSQSSIHLFFFMLMDLFDWTPAKKKQRIKLWALPEYIF
jgi:hypothetical protein